MVERLAKALRFCDGEEVLVEPLTEAEQVCRGDGRRNPA